MSIMSAEVEAAGSSPRRAPPLSQRNEEKAHTSRPHLGHRSRHRQHRRAPACSPCPRSWPGAGTMGIVVLGVIAVGAMLLAVLFGQLTKRVPNSDGGLYAYSRHEFGDFAGYLVGWCYWIQSWAGNAAIVVVLGVLRRRPLRLGPQHAAWRTGASPWSACGCRPSSTWSASARWRGSRTSPSSSSSSPCCSSASSAGSS